MCGSNGGILESHSDYTCRIPAELPPASGLGRPNAGGSCPADRNQSHQHSTLAQWPHQCVPLPPRSPGRRHGRSVASCSIACCRADERRWATGRLAARRDWQSCDASHVRLEFQRNWCGHRICGACAPPMAEGALCTAFRERSWRAATKSPPTDDQASHPPFPGPRAGETARTATSGALALSPQDPCASAAPPLRPDFQANSASISAPISRYF